MKRARHAKSAALEQRLVEIARRLPPERVIEVIDFAQFLETRLDTAGANETITEADERWDQLLSSDASQRLLEKLADQALAEREAGQARPIKFTDDGEIAPE